MTKTLVILLLPLGCLLCFFGGGIAVTGTCPLKHHLLIGTAIMAFGTFICCTAGNRND